jgi:hypothetical protein
VSHGEVGGLALGDGVEDDGGEVGHEVRRLAAQGRQVPHRSSLLTGPRPRAPRLLNLGGARPPLALPELRLDGWENRRRRSRRAPEWLRGETSGAF